MDEIIKKIDFLKDQRLIGRFRCNDKNDDDDLSTILNQIKISAKKQK